MGAHSVDSKDAKKMRIIKHTLLISLVLFIGFHLIYILKGGAIYSLYLLRYTILFFILWTIFYLIAHLCLNLILLSKENNIVFDSENCKAKLILISNYRILIVINCIFYLHLLLFSYLNGHSIYFHDTNSIMQLFNVNNYF